MVKTSRLNKALASRKQVLWEGPDGTGPNGGITYSLLCRFLTCRERFRIYVVEGLKADEGFSHRLEFGNMWHAAEAEYSRTKGQGDDWIRAVLQYAKQLASEYRQDQAEIQKWYRVILAQFPVYMAWWKKHKDVVKRRPVAQELTFDTPYFLPSGRVVRLRGKWDGLDLLNKSDLWIQENKSKGEFDRDRLERELPWDLQSMIYSTVANIEYPGQLCGVRYNVIRRPLSGGKFSISQKKGQGKAKKGAETEDEFYERLQGIIKENPEHFFLRFNMTFEDGDLERYQQRCLNVILEQLWDWWEWIKVNPSNPWASRFDPNSKSDYLTVNRTHFIFPTGVYNPLLEGRGTDLDRYIATGDDRGLMRSTTLFKELES